MLFRSLTFQLGNDTGVTYTRNSNHVGLIVGIKISSSSGYVREHMALGYSTDNEADATLTVFSGTRTKPTHIAGINVWETNLAPQFRLGLLPHHTLQGHSASADVFSINTNTNVISRVLGAPTITSPAQAIITDALRPAYSASTARSDSVLESLELGFGSHAIGTNGVDPEVTTEALYIRHIPRPALAAHAFVLMPTLSNETLRFMTVGGRWAMETPIAGSNSSGFEMIVSMTAPFTMPYS